MTDRSDNSVHERPHLYYKSRDDIEAYRNKPLYLKLQWLEEQMEFLHKAMPPKAKKIRDKLERGEI